MYLRYPTSYWAFYSVQASLYYCIVAFRRTESKPYGSGRGNYSTTHSNKSYLF
ncbi:MAG: hypothetical protein LBL74_00265 [Bacteroidales bacterium]|nr:hypothetical protein [Bacteroidales bacterium]